MPMVPELGQRWEVQKRMFFHLQRRFCFPGIAMPDHCAASDGRANDVAAKHPGAQHSPALDVGPLHPQVKHRAALHKGADDSTPIDSGALHNRRPVTGARGNGSADERSAKHGGTDNRGPDHRGAVNRGAHTGTAAYTHNITVADIEQISDRRLSRDRHALRNHR